MMATKAKVSSSSSSPSGKIMSSSSGGMSKTRTAVTSSSSNSVLNSPTTLKNQHNPPNNNNNESSNDLSDNQNEPTNVEEGPDENTNVDPNSSQVKSTLTSSSQFDGSSGFVSPSLLPLIGSGSLSNLILMHWSGPRTTGQQPQGMWKHCTVAVGSKFYIFGVYGRKQKRTKLEPQQLQQLQQNQTPLATSNSNLGNSAANPQSVQSHSSSTAQPTSANTEKLLIFDTDSICWKVRNQSGDIPDKPLYAHTASCYDEKIYIFGGGEGSQYYNDLWVLDTKTMVWTKPTTSGSIPAPRRAHSATVIDNSLYIFGGGSGNSALNDLYKLDLDKLQWTQIQVQGDIPKARGYHTTTVYQKKSILLMGGSGSSEIFKDVYTFDTESRRWTRHGLEAPFPRCAHSTTVVGHLLFVFGGNTGTELTNDLSILNLDTMKWKGVTQTGTIPSKRSHHTMTFADNRLVLIGGFDGRSYLADVHYLDLGTYGYLTSKR